MHKMIFAGWVVSLIVFLGILILTYAFFSEEVMVFQASSGEPFYLSRHQVFYFSLFISVLVNVVLYVLARVMDFSYNGIIAAKRVELRNWLYGFSAVVNVFFIFSLGFISLINSGTNYSPEDLSFMIYVAPVMLVGCLLWLFMVLVRK